jgi:Spy/CpxP family protein refolding chaperone
MERGDLLIGRGLTLAMAAAARRNGGLWIKRGSGGGGGERERELRDWMGSEERF